MSVGTSVSSSGVGPELDDSTVAEVKSLLVRGAQERAREQYEGLVARHQHQISRIAFRYLKNEADVDEAVQDTFVKAFLHLPSHQQKVPFIAWLIRIAINTCLDQLKAKSRRNRWMLPLVDSSGNERTGVAEQVTRNQNRVDGVCPIYVLLEVLQPSSSKLLKYDQSVESEANSVVTFASMGFYA